MTLRKPVYIVAAKRTAFGAFGGSLKHLSAVELGTVAARGAIASLPGCGPDVIDSCVFGNVAQTTTDVVRIFD
jgi:acetyl-CoA acyltransferase 2